MKRLATEPRIVMLAGVGPGDRRLKVGVNRSPKAVGERGECALERWGRTKILSIC